MCVCVRTVDTDRALTTQSDSQIWCVHSTQFFHIHMPDDFYFVRFIWVFIL